MRSVRYRYRRNSNATEINMAPLIDMIFILLIFFLVTTTFTQQSGIDVERPKAHSATLYKQKRLSVVIDENSIIYVDGKSIDVRLLKGRVKQYLSSNPDGAVIVVADKDCPTGFVVHVMDLCRLAGIRNISLAAEQSE